MTWEEIRNYINEPLWDNISKTWFWVTKIDDTEKSMEIRAQNGLGSKLLFAENQFYKTQQREDDFIAR